MVRSKYYETNRKWRAANSERVRRAAKKWRKTNRKRVNATTRAWNKANQPRRRVIERRARLKSVYGLSLAAYEALLLGQDHRCAACAADLSALPTKQRHVDHDHLTGAVRGILCHSCNTALGLMKDSPKRLQQLISYLMTRR